MEISVIIPCYQAGRTIANCVNSIINQQFNNYELWLIDDGSTDGTGRICDEMAEKNSHVHVFHQQNAGRTAARWQGVQMAKGEWICSVDADDTLPGNALQLLHDATTNNTDIVFGNGFTLGIQDKQPFIDINTFRHLAVRAEGTIGVPWGSLYRKTIISADLFDLPKEIYMGEDYIFWLRLVFKTTRPVATVWQRTYHKGTDTTSSRFVWTTDYASKIQSYREQSIPPAYRNDYLADTTADRKANLMACTLFEPRKTWKKSPFYRNLLADMNACHMVFSARERLFLALPARWLRRCYSWASRKKQLKNAVNDSNKITKVL